MKTTPMKTSADRAPSAASSTIAIAGEAGHPCPVCARSSDVDDTVLNGYALSRCSGCGYRFAAGAFGVDVDYREVYTTAEYLRTQVDPIGDAKARRAFRDMATYRAFFERVPLRSGSRLLDVGCGVGRFCHAASDAGWDVAGVDISEEAVTVGKRFASFPMYCGTLASLPTSMSGFDAVTSFEVLEHLFDPVSMLTALKERVRPGGSVFCTVPNWDCAHVRETPRADWVPPVHLGFHTESSARAMAAAAGFASFEVGVIETDPLPSRLAATIGWVRRRVVGSRSEPMGLWLHAVR